MLFRRKGDGPADEPALKVYLCCAPATTPLDDPVRISAAQGAFRWPIKVCFAEDQRELGMDHYEPRFGRRWHHHMIMVILAHHFLARRQQRPQAREGPFQQPNVPSAVVSILPSPEPATLAPALNGLSLAEVARLLRTVLPLPTFDPTAALALLANQRQRKAAASYSHRTGRLERLAERLE